ncbi:hypothetical protein BIV57_13565 [Mangrovactinospora gilvigrisea]|uniref:TcpE family protein n=1 Tax=Mangrovactinospora gilvigrisea TaxID=1428644 RepID=A0A1J7BEA6_9ACTN|nr:hypothetical protein [Mangrovactinospora gilvigrisea]OIV37011.1 hypothetical protein BIV57_13565 [Mangrovactinospora gilvigrisea]
MSTADEALVGRCYTRARRRPPVIGQVPGGGRIPGGPYTLTQVAVMAGMAAVMALTQSLWGHFGIVDLVLMAVIPWGSAWLLRFARVDGRDPMRAGLALLNWAGTPVGGRIAGRGVGRPRRVLLRGSCTVHVRSTADEQAAAQQSAASPAPAAPAVGEPAPAPPKEPRPRRGGLVAAARSTAPTGTEPVSPATKAAGRPAPPASAPAAELPPAAAALAGAEVMVLPKAVAEHAPIPPTPAPAALAGGRRPTPVRPPAGSPPRRPRASQVAAGTRSPAARTRLQSLLDQLDDGT